MAMKRRKIRELKDEIERRELVALERRAGTEIRVATVEREAITADYWIKVTQIRIRKIEVILERFANLLDFKEAQLFIEVLFEKDEELSALLATASFISAITKLVAFPKILQDAGEAIKCAVEPILACNESKERLRKEGIDVGNPLPLPAIPFEWQQIEWQQKILMLKRTLEVLAEALAYFKWLKRYSTITRHDGNLCAVFQPSCRLKSSFSPVFKF